MVEHCYCCCDCNLDREHDVVVGVAVVMKKIGVQVMMAFVVLQMWLLWLLLLRLHQRLRRLHQLLLWRLPVILTINCYHFVAVAVAAADFVVASHPASSMMNYCYYR